MTEFRSRLVPIMLVMAITLPPNELCSRSGAESTPLTERRRRSRVAGETLGWILPAQPRLAMHMPDDEEAWEVRVVDISRFGAGFISTEPLDPGAEYRLRIGRGPIKRSRLIRIVACREFEPGNFSVGAEFVDNPARDLAKAS